MASRPYGPAVSTTFNATAASVVITIPTFGVRRVRMECTQDCYVTISNPALVATAANGILLRAPTYGQEFGIMPNDVISVIQVSVGGSLNVTPMGDV